MNNLLNPLPMAMKRLLVIVTLMLSILALPATALAETLYVKKSGTKLQSEASASSKVVETLASGTAVKVVKKSGRFYQVTAAGGKKGWIFKFKLTAKAPSGGGGSLLDALGGQQMAAKESASGSSIRGLSPISEQHASKGISKESINAVKAMEEFKVSAQEVDAFLKAGKLGEYAQ
jgi:hypothetical protein